eukprot:gene15330-18162_t
MFSRSFILPSLASSTRAGFNSKNLSNVSASSKLFPATSALTQQPLFAKRSSIVAWNHPMETAEKRLFSSKPAFTMVETKIEDLPKPDRPTSPHLTIYKFPLPAVLSITHRATGICLGLGLATLAGLSVFGAHDVPFYIQQFKTLYPALVFPAKFFVAFPITFHALAGLRHLYWDMALKGIGTKSAEVTGMVIVAVSVVISFIISFMEINAVN